MFYIDYNLYVCVSVEMESVTSTLSLIDVINHIRYTVSSAIHYTGGEATHYKVGFIYKPINVRLCDAAVHNTVEELLADPPPGDVHPSTCEEAHSEISRLAANGVKKR